MVRADTISLITETRKAHGIHEEITETAREIPAEVKSVNRHEYYAGLNAGVSPEIVFKLALDADYENERYLRWRGLKYVIRRTYLTSDGGIELTCERSDENAGNEND